MLLAALACSDGAGTSSSLPLKDVSRLAAQLDTIDAGFTSPQLKSLSALALPMLTAGLELQHMDSTILGKTVEWDPIGERVILTTRPGTPRNVLQVTLYELDETGLARYPKVEIGYAYLEPLNKFTGGRSDSTSLRFTVFKLPNPNPAAVGASALDPHGQEILDLTDAHVLGRLFDVPADIADYIEWPTFVLFFCGC